MYKGAPITLRFNSLGFSIVDDAQPFWNWTQMTLSEKTTQFAFVPFAFNLFMDKIEKSTHYNILNFKLKIMMHPFKISKTKINPVSLSMFNNEVYKEL